VYLYEFAAADEYRRNLADIRAGEYEGLARSSWTCGGSRISADHLRAALGATVIGARKFLIAYNINLNTMDKRLANRVAFDVREKGRKKKDAEGNVLLDAKVKRCGSPGSSSR